MSNDNSGRTKDTSKKIKTMITSGKDKNKISLLLHTGEIYMENLLGYLSLLSLLGLIGIFTVNKVYLGFFCFLYFIRYFLIIPDESFKANLLKAAAPAIFMNIAFSIFIFLIWLVVHMNFLFPLGLVVGLTASVFLFAALLELYLRGYNVSN